MDEAILSTQAAAGLQQAPISEVRASSYARLSRLGQDVPVQPLTFQQAEPLFHGHVSQLQIRDSTQIPMQSSMRLTVRYGLSPGSDHDVQFKR